MLDDASRISPAGLLRSLQLFENPMFVVTVGPDEELRFGGLNHAHERDTGLSSRAIAGKTPHEALPPRIADTVSPITWPACARMRPPPMKSCWNFPVGHAGGAPA
ncbi:MAG: hypothetical protein AAFY80_01305 [Pseudomonadota bacterium]